MVQINDDYHEDLTIEKLDRILDDIAQKTAARPTP
jgi:NADH:ubiquinone oxidoreductase subunit E